MSPVSEPKPLILMEEAQYMVTAISSLHQEAVNKLIRAMADCSAKDRMIASLQQRLSAAEEKINSLNNT